MARASDGVPGLLLHAETPGVWNPRLRRGERRAIFYGVA